MARAARWAVAAGLLGCASSLEWRAAGGVVCAAPRSALLALSVSLLVRAGAGQGWYASEGGESCTDVCDWVTGNTLECTVESMAHAVAQINNADTFAFVNNELKNVIGVGGLSCAPPGPQLLPSGPTGSSLGHDVFPGRYNVGGSEECYWVAGFTGTLSPAPTCSAKRPSRRRFCCCVTSGTIGTDITAACPTGTCLEQPPPLPDSLNQKGAVRKAQGTGGVGFAWYSCAPGWELSGSRLAYCQQQGTGASAAGWGFDNPDEKPTCTECPATTFKAQGGGAGFAIVGVNISDAVAGETAQCIPCPANQFQHKTGQASCDACPVTYTGAGVACNEGLVHIESGWWWDSSKGALRSDTQFYQCEGEGKFCPTASDGTGPVLCAAGYTGPLCGGCDGAQGMIRSGTRCTNCWATAWNVLAVLASTAVFIGGLLYILAIHDLTIDINSNEDVYHKLLFSYLQMLGVLGIFKARGTSAFQAAIGQPASLAGGAITTAVFIKCLFMSPVYVSFSITMAAPPIIALLCVVMMGPISFCMTIKHRFQIARAITVPRWEGDSEGPPVAETSAWHAADQSDTLHAYFASRALDPARRVAGARPKIGCFLTKVHVCFYGMQPPCKACVAEMSDHDEWKYNEHKRKSRRRFIGAVRLRNVLVFIVYCIYPTLVRGVMTVLRCSAFIEGKQYLIADMNEECYAGAHQYFSVIAWLFLFFYCLGIPLGVALLLLCKVQEVNDTEDEDKAVGARFREDGLGDSDGGSSDAGASDSTTVSSDDEDGEVPSVSAAAETEFQRFIREEKMKKMKRKSMRKEKSSRLGAAAYYDGDREASGASDSSDSLSGDGDGIVGWTQHRDDVTRRNYWSNDSSGATTWKRPANLGPLKANWVEHYSKQDAAFYWSNTETGASTWDRPTDQGSRRPNGGDSATATESAMSRYRKVKETAADLVRKAGAAHTRAKYTKQATAEAIAKYTLSTLGRGSATAISSAADAASEPGRLSKSELKSRKELRMAKLRAKFEEQTKREHIKTHKREQLRQRDRWYYEHEDGATYGPYPRKTLREFRAQGKFDDQDQFKRECDTEPTALAAVLRIGDKLGDKKCRVRRFQCTKRGESEYGFTADNRISDFRKSYGFLLAGYNRERGSIIISWEVVIMLRKLVISSIATLIAEDAYLQICSALALLVLALAMHATFEPYDGDTLNTVETLSLVGLIMTQVVSVLYLYIDSPAAPAGFKAAWVEGLITTVLIVMNVAVILLITALYAISKASMPLYDKLFGPVEIDEHGRPMLENRVYSPQFRAKVWAELQARVRALLVTAGERKRASTPGGSTAGAPSAVEMLAAGGTNPQQSRWQGNPNARRLSAEV